MIVVLHTRIAPVMITTSIGMIHVAIEKSDIKIVVIVALAQAVQENVVREVLKVVQIPVLINIVVEVVV